MAHCGQLIIWKFGFERDIPWTEIAFAEQVNSRDPLMFLHGSMESKGEKLLVDINGNS